MSISLEIPKLKDLTPRIVVFGVGGAGCNAINNMIASGLDGVEYVAANTDAQALSTSSAERRIQLGVNLTEGLGAGAKPEIGQAAAEEALDEIRSQVAGAHMVFIAAGMGGGTGTGAASVIARVARDCDVLTVGIVTKPFHFEGSRRMRVAEAGIAELRKYVDTLIVIPNQNLFRIANDRTTFAEAFVLADQVLYSGIACVVDLIIKEGLINLDFADVRAVMTGMGSAMMGTGEASGEHRAILAAEEAIANPLLDEVSLKGAKGLLLSIIGGPDMTLFEVDEAANRVRQEVDPEANIIVGATFDESMGDRIRVAIVASGLGMSPGAQAPRQPSIGQPPVSRGAVAHDPARHQPAAAVRDPFAQPADPYPAPGAPAASPPVRTTGEVGDPFATASAAARPLQAPMPEPEPAFETWQAPGDVTITVAPPSLPQRAGTARNQRPVDEPPARPAPFTPAAPEDHRRAPRRMPEADDFPDHVQAELRTKMGRAADATNPSTAHAPPPPPAPQLTVNEGPQSSAPKSSSTFQRWLGRGNGKR
ncbi:MAG: cell division protein FtsZ [Hyphomicrobiaceae bacterium]